MKRRELLGAFAAAGAMSAASRRRNAKMLADCGCALQVQRSKATPPGSDVFKDAGSKLRITNMQVFGVTLDERIAQADRPYVFVKLETNLGVVGWAKRRWKARLQRPWRASWTSRTSSSAAIQCRSSIFISSCTSAASIAAALCSGRRSPALTRRCGTFAAR